MALGYFTHSWAHAEATLDALVGTLHFACGGNTIEDELPRSLDRRIAFIRSCHNKLPALAEWKAKGLEIADRFGEMRNSRHTLTHGLGSPNRGFSEAETICQNDCPRDINIDDQADHRAWRSLDAADQDNLGICPFLSRAIRGRRRARRYRQHGSGRLRSSVEQTLTPIRQESSHALSILATDLTNS